MKFTVLGADGFIGSACVTYLRAQGHEVLASTRRADVPPDTALGHVIYAIGLTGDFRSRPFETVEAHVTELARWLKAASYDSFLYLSSTRVFSGNREPTVDELTPAQVTPSADALYNLSKLAGEALCLAQPLSEVRVARLSNVYGAGQSADSFLGAVLSALRAHGYVEIREDASSAKDYIALTDLPPLFEAIAMRGKERLYHVASGANVTHRALAEALAPHPVTFQSGAVARTFPLIDTARIRSEFAFTPRRLLDDLPGLLQTSANV